MLKDQQVTKAEGSSGLQVHGTVPFSLRPPPVKRVLFNRTLSGKATTNARNKVR